MSTQATYPVSDEEMVRCYCNYRGCRLGPGGFTLQRPRTECLHRYNDVERDGKYDKRRIIINTLCTYHTFTSIEYNRVPEREGPVLDIYPARGGNMATNHAGKSLYLDVRDNYILHV